MQNTPSGALRAAIDIGGTFTDTVLMQGADKVIATAKTLTTHGSPTTGAIAGLTDVLHAAGESPAELSLLVHGTTLATNALIERAGARAAVITTEGFRDILEIGYERRYSQYDIDIEKPDLILRRDRCFTIAERMSVQGDVLVPLDEGAVDDLVRDLRACAAEAVAICLLHAYANPVHERRLRALIGAKLPDLAISISSEVSPEAREFDRMCTTLANAYVQPLMSRYLVGLADAVSALGAHCPLLVMTAGGGMTTVETAARLPIRLVESGPAGGAILASRIAEQTQSQNVLSFDMGGTTAKLCLIDDYRPQTARTFEVGRAARFIKGSGMPVRIPVVDMIEIGAGGGSIAGVDSIGRLTVGPRSAGSNPGPAAFGLGGKHPTVTDADLCLGLIDPAAFAGGSLQIDVAAATDAIDADIGRALQLGPRQAAMGIAEIVDESMATAARMHAVECGKDLTKRTMIAFGGNGPLHATRVARRADVFHIIIPRDPSVGSAVGFLHAPASYEVIRSLHAPLARLDLARVNALFDEMIQEADAIVSAVPDAGDLCQRRTAFMRYRGQGHEIEIELPPRPLVSQDLSDLRGAFDAEYRRQFARVVPDMAVEILNWGLTLSSARCRQSALAMPQERVPATSPDIREIFCDITEREIDAAVYHRSALEPGMWLQGPALIVEAQTTTLVSADFEATIDLAGNIHLFRNSNLGSAL